jgi:hypothetical protein
MVFPDTKIRFDIGNSRKRFAQMCPNHPNVRLACAMTPQEVVICESLETV